MPGLTSWLSLRPLMLTALLVALAWPAMSQANEKKRQYELSTRTGMPNLDENLRYAIRTEQHCLTRDELFGSFWMLSDVSLQDCQLTGAKDHGDSVTHQLHCTGGYGTSGQTRWRPTAAGWRGRLDVRLGGKNMTLYQTIVAVEIGSCPKPPKQ